jgi:lipoprotein LprG
MRRALAATAVLLAVLTGCSDDKEPTGNGGGNEPDPVALLTDAKKVLDEAASVHFVITGKDIPDSARALLSADGQATHAPAFKGKLTVQSGQKIDAEVVAVGGKVYAKPSFSPAFIEVKPADLGAPDPAVLLDPAKGLTAMLPVLKDPAIKGESRQGAQVLTEVSGSIEGKTLTAIFPGAPTDKSFPSVFKIDKESKQLVSAMISGPFYGDATSSYDVTLDRYGEQVQITKP